MVVLHTNAAPPCTSRQDRSEPLEAKEGKARLGLNHPRGLGSKYKYPSNNRPDSPFHLPSLDCATAAALILSYPSQYKQENGTSRHSVAPSPRHSPGTPSSATTRRRAGSTAEEEGRGRDTGGGGTVDRLAAAAARGWTVGAGV
jgi:hypothetical protein